MYYREKGNGIHFGGARALTWTLESMEDAFLARLLAFPQTHFLFASNTLQPTAFGSI